MLTNDEIKMLTDGLDALLSKSSTNGLLTGLLGGMFISDKDERERQLEKEVAKAKLEREEIEDRVILLKAKLIGMKDKNIVESFVSDALGSSSAR